MTSHERFEAVVEHRIPDRFPMDLIWPRAETLKALEVHFKTDSKENIFRELGVDFRWIPVPVDYPEFKKRVNRALGGVAPGAGQDYIFHDVQTFENHWGVIHRVGDDGKYLEWKGGPLVGKESLDGWTTPETVYPSKEEIGEYIKPYRDYMTVAEIEFPFKIAWHMCGYDHFMLLMALNPEVVEALYDRLYEFQTEKAVLAAQAGYDVVAIVGDIAGQNGMMFSVDMFGRFDVPRFKKLISSVKKANPATKLLYHSDGDIEKVIPQLIECGIDILNPIQSACMDPSSIKQKFGDRLTFHGTISVQDTIPHGTVEEVRDEVTRRMLTVGKDGGFIVSPENSIPYDAPLDNILAIYSTVLEFDYARL